MCLNNCRVPCRFFWRYDWGQQWGAGIGRRPIVGPPLNRRHRRHNVTSRRLVGVLGADSRNTRVVTPAHCILSSLCRPRTMCRRSGRSTSPKAAAGFGSSIRRSSRRVGLPASWRFAPRSVASPRPTASLSMTTPTAPSHVGAVAHVGSTPNSGRNRAANPHFGL